MKLLVGTLGDLGLYREAEYTYSEKIAKAKGSLFALCKILNPHHVILLIPDSLVVNIGEGTMSWSSYSDLTSFLKSRYEGTLREDPLFLKDFSGNLYLWAMPSVGEFKSQKTGLTGSFKGNLMDYYYKLFFKAADFLIEHVIKNDSVEELEVYIDISLGLNYTNLLTFRVFRELIRYLTLRCPASLFVLNADPVVTGVIPSNIDFHHVFDGEKISTSFNFENIVPDYNNPFPTRVYDSQDIELSRENSNRFKSWRSYHGRDIKDLYIHDVLCFLSSVKNSIPLGIFHFFPSTGDIHNLLEDSINWFMSNVRIESVSESKVKVRRALCLSPYFRSFCLSYFISEIFQKLGIIKSSEVSFECISNIADLLYGRLKIFRDRIKEEISNLSRKCKKEEYVKWKPFQLVGSGLTKDSNTERNFFAHAGIAQNVVELKAISGNFEEEGSTSIDSSSSVDAFKKAFHVRYRKECEKDVINMLISNL
ncbi:MAG: CRISPR-associated CARF protein Csx1 [candidate division WOR-3 bacterium]